VISCNPKRFGKFVFIYTGTALYNTTSVGISIGKVIVNLRYLTACLLILTLVACSHAPLKPEHVARSDYHYTRQYISWLIKEKMASDKVTGLSIALVDDQKVVWEQGFGYEDMQAGVKASPDTVYSLGSIAKVFTATAVMQLADQNKLDINRPLQQYLPEFSIKSRYGNTDGITLRNIMTHHSGLPGYWVRGMSERHPQPFTKQVTAVKNEYVAWPPNYVFDYSNLGYCLLGDAIGKISKESYAGYMDKNILQPLGMTHSEFAARIPGKAYKKNEEVEAIPLRDLPSSSLNSSVSDMARFMRMLFADGKYNGRQVISAKALQEMFKVQNRNIPLDFDFKMGLGWMLSGVDVPYAGVVASHGGTTLNYHSMMTVLPEHKLGVVVMSNSAGSEDIVSVVTRQTLKLALEAKTGVTHTVRHFVEQKTIPLNAKDLRVYTGYFETLIGLVKVENENGDLIARLMGFKFQLVKHTDGEFGVRLKLLGFIPVANQQMKEMNLSLHHIDGHDVLEYKKDGQAQLVGEKLHPKPIPAYLDDYVGNYEIVNPDDGPMPENIRIVRDGDFLIGEFNSSIMPNFLFRTAFLPIARNELVIAGIGSGKGETLHLKKINGEEHIFYSGFDLRKIPGSEKRMNHSPYYPDPTPFGR
jgi:CubicO group peptidase (beta-lactamase class C family)